MKSTLKTRIPNPGKTHKDYFVYGGDYSELVLSVETLTTKEAKNALCRLIDLLQIIEKTNETGDLVIMFEAQQLIKKIVFLKESKKVNKNAKNTRRIKSNSRPNPKHITK
jgi:hypothetical protein